MSSCIRLLRWIAGAVVVLLAAAAALASDLPTDLSHCAELATSGRFDEVVEILSPYETIALDDESRYIVSAELGRAHFHGGSYAKAHALFRNAVKLRPDRVETALYLQASSWVTGDRTQALGIFESVLSSGARDLWLAVTLPGERFFLRDPEVWNILQRHRIALSVDVAHGRVLDVELGQDRSEVERRLGVVRADGSASILTAQAGPEIIWAFHFDDRGALRGVTLYADHLLRYTPYRLQLGDADGWQLTPESAQQLLGEARRLSTGVDGSMSLEWELEELRLTLDFTPADNRRLPVHPKSEYILSMLRIDDLQSTSERHAE